MGDDGTAAEGGTSVDWSSLDGGDASYDAGVGSASSLDGGVGADASYGGGVDAADAGYASAQGGGTAARIEAYIDQQLGEYRRMFSEQRYGCWCGPGHVCENDTDDIDACCHHHDLGYDAAGIGAGPTMWTADGLIKGEPIDSAFVSCLASTITGPTWHGPAGVDYRSLAMAIFGARIAAAEAIKAEYASAADDSMTGSLGGQLA